MYAVIRTGGKQYRVAPNDVLQIEKLPGSAGDVVQFGDVLMLGAESGPTLGTPTVAGAGVSAEIVEQGRGEKIIIFKKRRRQNYRRRNGHRQYLTTVRILDILENIKIAEAPKAEAKPKKDKAPEAGVPAAVEKPKAAKPNAEQPAEKAADTAEKPKAAKKPAKKDQK
jgi:large subunit ribosomal protein L21